MYVVHKPIHPLVIDRKARLKATRTLLVSPGLDVPDVCEDALDGEQAVLLAIADVTPGHAQQVAHHVVTEPEAHCIERGLHSASHTAQERHVQHGSVVS